MGFAVARIDHGYPPAQRRAHQTCLCGTVLFIGAVSDTNWLPNMATDKAGFIRTDTQLDHGLGPSWETLRRRPLPFETSIPGAFAAGDVRLGSMKRVAAAMGEGASAVASVHTRLTLPEVGK